MATKSGRIADVKVGLATVAGQGTWTLGGFTREVIEEDSWDLDIKKKFFSVGDAGTITFSGLYDAADPNGQRLLDSACKNSSLLISNILKLFIDAVSYWTNTTGHSILLTKCQSITLEKSSMGTVDFEGVVSVGAMVLV